MIEVELTEEEIFIAKYIADQRFLENRKAGVKNTASKVFAGSEADQQGMLGEMALCKHFNLYPDLSIQPRVGGYDMVLPTGITLDVKATKYKTGKLISPPWKKEKEDSQVYVLALLYDAPKVHIVGWATKDKLFQEQNLKVIRHGHHPCYVLERKELEPMEKLLDYAA